MLPRLSLLDRRVPITLVQGQRSWMRQVSDGTGRSLDEELQTVRSGSYVSLHTVPDAGHHLHADQPESFCRIVNGACSRADRGEDRVVQPQADRGGDRMVQPQADRGGDRVVQPQADRGEDRVVQPQADRGGDRVVQPQADRGEDRVVQPQADRGEDRVVQPQADRGEDRVVQPQEAAVDSQGEGNSEQLDPSNVIEPK